MAENKEYTRRKDCRLCHSSHIEVVTPLVPTPIGLDYVTADRLDKTQKTYPLDLSLCNDCGFVQLSDVIDPEILYRNYLYHTSVSLGTSEHFKKYADEAINFANLSKDSFVIEIASNDGTLLKLFKDKGMRVLGVEPSNIAEETKKIGIETLPDFFTQKLSSKIKDKYGSADVIASNNVLANIDDLDDVFDGIRNLLKPDGISVFDTGYVTDLVQNNLLDVIHHEHISFFSAKSLNPFLKNHGMELIDVKRIPIKGGSLRGIIQQTGGPYRASKSVEDLINLETELKMDKPETFRDFSDRISSGRKNISSLLDGLKKEGKSIAGYGASIGTTTLIYNLGIGNFLEFIADDNPLAQNTFTPGFHIPVLPSRKIYERKPDYVVSLALRHSKPIIEKNQNYLDQGGHFIIPFPNLEVV